MRPNLELQVFSYKDDWTHSSNKDKVTNQTRQIAQTQCTCKSIGGVYQWRDLPNEGVSSTVWSFCDVSLCSQSESRSSSLPPQSWNQQELRSDGSSWAPRPGIASNSSFPLEIIWVISWLWSSSTLIDSTQFQRQGGHFWTPGLREVTESRDMIAFSQWLAVFWWILPGLVFDFVIV